MPGGTKQIYKSFGTSDDNFVFKYGHTNYEMRNFHEQQRFDVCFLISKNSLSFNDDAFELGLLILWNLVTHVGDLLLCLVDDVVEFVAGFNACLKSFVFGRVGFRFTL